MGEFEFWHYRHYRFLGYDLFLLTTIFTDYILALIVLVIFVRALPAYDISILNMELWTKPLDRS